MTARDHAYGRELRAARERAGLTLTSLARRLGVSQPHLGEVEAGSRGPLGPERDREVWSAVGIPPSRLDALRSAARGVVSVEGLALEDVERVARLAQRLRAARRGRRE